MRLKKPAKLWSGGSEPPGPGAHRITVAGRDSAGKTMPRRNTSGLDQLFVLLGKSGEQSEF